MAQNLQHPGEHSAWALAKWQCLFKHAMGTSCPANFTSLTGRACPPHPSDIWLLQQRLGTLLLVFQLAYLAYDMWLWEARGPLSPWKPVASPHPGAWPRMPGGPCGS